MMGPDGEPYDGKLPGEDGPTLFDALVAAIDEMTSDELAELLEQGIDDLAALVRDWQTIDDHKRLARTRHVLSMLREIMEHDDQDPRRNGWVDQYGRP